MHNAPSVTYPVGRSSLPGVLLAVLWLLGAAAAAAWAWQTAPSAGAQLLVAAVLALAGACALRMWRRLPEGELAWDGRGWFWPALAAEAGVLAVSLDLQRALLLRWQGRGEGRGAAQWLWLDRAACPERWGDLRRAVYSRATPDALAGARPPAAKP
ncbi:hypothetical protein [uncultured Ramlibacter sp.]|uniref:hypothetical protein n=1 Tax=uncultured Ramlibacter sp. TaxID=260755 RepID=UPI00263A3AAD|nr:hypothetical protein [uncultured Ramlibacter sp.]